MRIKIKIEMRLIDTEETIAWLARRGIVDSGGTLSFAGFAEMFRSEIPTDAGRKTALSRAIVSVFDTDDEALLWIREFGIWPSSEDRNLFDHFRRSLGDHSPLHEKPGHIFSSNELKDIGSFMCE